MSRPFTDVLEEGFDPDLLDDSETVRRVVIGWENAAEDQVLSGPNVGDHGFHASIANALEAGVRPLWAEKEMELLARWKERKEERKEKRRIAAARPRRVRTEYKPKTYYASPVDEAAHIVNNLDQYEEKMKSYFGSFWKMLTKEELNKAIVARFCR